MNAAALVTLLVIGIDSASWQYVDTLAEGGGLPGVEAVNYVPNLTALKASSAYADLPCNDAGGAPCFCPILWGTYTTGQPVSVHQSGIGANPFNTPPVVPTLLDLVPNSGAAGWHHLGPFDDELVADMADAMHDTTAGGVSRGPNTHLRPMWFPLAEDRAIELAVQYMALFEPELILSIFRSTDRVSHVAWDHVQGTPGGPYIPLGIRVLGDSWPGDWRYERDDAEGWLGEGRSDPVAVYRDVDAAIGRLLAQIQPTYVMLLSDHGMTRDASCAPSLPAISGHHCSTADLEAHTGLFAVSGPGITPGNLGSISALDVAPTILELLGRPIPAEWPGTPVVQVGP